MGLYKNSAFEGRRLGFSGFRTEPKNQKAAGVFDMSNPANTTQHLGGGTVKPSSGTAAKLKVDTKSARGKLLGGKGAVHDAIFNVLKYR